MTSRNEDVTWVLPTIAAAVTVLFLEGAERLAHGLGLALALMVVLAGLAFLEAHRRD